MNLLPYCLNFTADNIYYVQNFKQIFIHNIYYFYKCKILVNNFTNGFNIVRLKLWGSLCQKISMKKL